MLGFAGWLAVALGALLLLAVAGLWLLAVRGVVTLNLGWGRSFHRLGPLVVRVQAPRELVFEQIAAPYLGRTPSQLRDKLEVLERGTDMVLAAHRTPLRGLTVTTVETVRFSPPERVDFRHLRGPVPHVLEAFTLRESGSATEVEYAGELGLDLWLVGRLWARRVVPVWNRVVETSLQEVKRGAEARAAAQERRGRSGIEPV